MWNNSAKIRFLPFAQILGLTIIFSGLIFATQDHYGINNLFLAKKNQALHNMDHPRSVETIDLAQTLQFFNDPKSIFIDVRDKKFFDYGHIERAKPYPINEMQYLSEAELNNLKEAPAVIIYCNGIPCSLVYVGAQKLLEKGVKNVKIYAEGWPEWRKCQLPITMSEQMKLDIQNERL